jgi:hypothetical protein
MKLIILGLKLSSTNYCLASNLITIININGEVRRLNMKFTLIRFVMASTWITLAYKLADWKNWKKYYPTMLLFGMGDLIYSFIFYEKPLWKFQSDTLTFTLNELFVIFLIFFPVTMLYLSKYPKKLSHQIIYISFWILIFMIIELFTTSIGMQKNYNGWTMWWSLLHNSIQFPILILHYKNPILAWSIALVFLVIIMNIFKVPFTI